MVSIPCWLTNRDLLSPVRGMVAHLLECDDVGEITIVDCGSSYPPLIDWYTGECPVNVILDENHGPRAAWRHIVADEFYFESDADLDLTDVPRDFLPQLQEGLCEHPEAIKAGLSLRIDDLPADGPGTPRVRAHESQFWRQRIDAHWFSGDIDTTAALYRPHHGWRGYGPALRAAPPYTARHLAWYLASETLNEEWRYYFEHLSPEGIAWSPYLRELFGLSPESPPSPPALHIAPNCA